MSQFWQNLFDQVSSPAANDSYDWATGQQTSSRARGQVPGPVGSYGPTPTYDPNAPTFRTTPAPGFTNDSQESYWIKPEDDYDASGHVVSQRDPDKNSKVAYWASGAYEVPAGSYFPVAIDGYTKPGLGYVVKLSDLCNRGVWADKNGKVHLPTWNLGGGRKTSPPDDSWRQLFDISQR